MRSPDRWLALGGAVFGAGALLVISWLIYAFQSKADFWAWPGITGVAVGGVGFVALAVGFTMPKDADKAPAPTPQSLHAGARFDQPSSGPGY